MTTTPATPDDSVTARPEAASGRSRWVRLPGIATALLVLSPFFLVLGAVNFLATGPRGYFDNAPTQAMVGVVIFGAGVGLLLAGLVLVGVRTIAQRQVDLLLEARR